MLSMKIVKVNEAKLTLFLMKYHTIKMYEWRYIFTLS
jgi:hypothetical protein